MTTAVDTNVFSHIWSGGAEAGPAQRALRECSGDGVLVISPIVYAEMLANPRVSAKRVRQFLGDTGVRTEFDMLPAVWDEAGKRFGEYAGRRRMSGGGEARRLIADFVVGAHALRQTQRLLTFDRKFYEVAFPELRLVELA